MTSILLKLLKPFKANVIILFSLILLTAFFESFGLALLLPLVENILQENSTTPLTGIINSVFDFLRIEKTLTSIGILFITIIILKNLFKILSTFFNTKIVFNIRKYWILKINNNYMYCPYGNIIKEKQGVLVNNLVFETQKAATGILKINEFLISVSMVISYIALMFLADPKVALISFSIFGLLFIIFSFLGKNKLAEFGRKELSLNQRTNAVASENISAMRQVRTFSIEEKINNVLNDYLKKLTSISIKYEFIKSIPRAFVEVLIFTIIISIIIFFQKDDSNMLQSFIPVLSVFILTSQRLLGQFNILISSKYSFDFYRPTFQLIDSIINQTDTIISKRIGKNGKDIHNIDSDIVFEDVSFFYEKGNNVINNVNINIIKGEITAIYGPSGSGKSTIADLILGLYKPKKGSIYVNGDNLSNFNLSSWRKRIGFISQDNYLFHDSILENIKVGKPGATMDEVIFSSKQAQAYDFINNLPNGFETQVGDRGLLLSGGQKQRIAIARAMVRDPDLLIFDEATSALDNDTESKLMEIIYNLSKNKTVIIITHKRDIIKKVDNIYKIENGLIQEIKNRQLFSDESSYEL
jgi:ABC-type multidrug transport system fused ATPase/permease subunit